MSIPPDFDPRLEALLPPSNPPHLLRAGRPGTRDAAAVHRAVSAHGKFAAEPRAAALALALLWHDHWDAAHEGVQTQEGRADFDLIHSLVHRREGDYGNAAYWLKRAGEHPAFAGLSPARLPWLQSEPALAKIVFPGGHFSAAGMLQAVQMESAGTALRAIQAEEYRALYAWLMNRP